MELKDWAAGIICARAHSERLCGKLDKLIEYSAVNSAFLDAEIAVGKVAALMERKNRLINMKVLSDKVQELFSLVEAEAVNLRFRERLMFADIAVRCGINRETAALRVNAALKRACRFLEENGFDLEYFEREFAGEKFWVEKALVKRVA